MLKELLSKLSNDKLIQIKAVDISLKTKQYTEDDLKFVMDNCSIGARVVLENQKELSLSFCKEYILNDDYWIFDFDKDISIKEILLYQPHLKEDDFR